MPGHIVIKGIREGLLVSVGEGPWDEVHSTFLEHLDQQLEFLKGARLALDVSDHILKAVELSQLRDEISERGLNLWAVISNSPTTEQTAQTLGLATRLNKPRPERETRNLDTSHQEGELATLVRRTLRSGFRLHFEGHIVVIGDVNPGAEIVASGDVLVWGRLRGMVHAGAAGNVEAVICALDLAPTQLRIAGVISTAPPRRGKPQPEMARLQDDRVVAQTWNYK